jgi:2-dehydropantoate 2-reductase
MKGYEEMEAIKKIFILGIGAIGSIYAARLYDMNPEGLAVIANKKRIERYSELGVYVNGKLYPFNYILPQEGKNDADLIIISVKHHQLEEAIEDISKFVGEDTIIISLLNGIFSEEIIGNKFGIEKLLYSYCVGTDPVRVGMGINYTNIGKIVFGERMPLLKCQNVLKLAELFDKALIPYQISENIIHQLWWKFMMNVGINQVSALLNAPYGVFQKVKEARELMIMASEEAILLANREGVDLGEKDIEEYLRILDALNPRGKTSMLQDIEASRKTEVEIFGGAIIELGEKFGVNTPVNNILFKSIRAMEQIYLEPKS